MIQTVPAYHPRIVEVIRQVTTKGTGTEDNPHRMVTQYFELTGELIFEVDTVAEIRKQQMSIQRGEEDDTPRSTR